MESKTQLKNGNIAIHDLIEEGLSFVAGET